MHRSASSAGDATGPVPSSPGSVKVRVRGLSKRFGATLANNNISLDIHEGEFLTLLGPSGCGKTTLMRLIAGLESPDGGRIWIDDREVTEEPPSRRGVGMVFQHYALFPHMTIFDNVAYGLTVRKHPRPDIERQVDRLLNLVHLPGVGSRYPAQLSGGQQQRVALARALATSPSVLMLDEPLGALDFKLRQEMQVELKRIHRQTGVTFLYVTHDQEEALRMSDRIAVLASGRIDQLGTPREVYESPATRFTADFIGDVALLPCEPVPGEPQAAKLKGAETAPAIPVQRNVPEDSSFALVVRPEHVVLRASGSGESLSGSVVEVLYGGGTTTYGIRLQGGHELKARQAGPPQSGLTIGCDVDIEIRGASVCLPDPE